LSVAFDSLSNMSSIDAALDALDAAVERLGAADVRELAAPERFVAVDGLETAVRRLVAISRAQRRFNRPEWSACFIAGAGPPLHQAGDVGTVDVGHE
jgi:gamma-glutamyltranspeptidase